MTSATPRPHYTNITVSFSTSTRRVCHRRTKQNATASHIYTGIAKPTTAGVGQCAVHGTKLYRESARQHCTGVDQYVHRLTDRAATTENAASKVPLAGRFILQSGSDGNNKGKCHARRQQLCTLLRHTENRHGTRQLYAHSDNECRLSAVPTASYLQTKQNG